MRWLLRLEFGECELIGWDLVEFDGSCRNMQSFFRSEHFEGDGECFDEFGMMRWVDQFIREICWSSHLDLELRMLLERN